MVRRVVATCALTAAVLLAPGGPVALGQGPPPAAPYAVVSPAGRQPLPVRTSGGQELVALDDLVRLFDLTVREEVAAGGLTVSRGSQSVVLTAGQSLASVGGRLISMSAAPVRDGRSWFLPLDFITRALAPVAGQRIELRRGSRLVVVGDVRVPRVTGRIDALGSGARLTLDIAPATPHSVRQENGRLVVRFEADALDATLPQPTTPELVRAIRPGEVPASLVLEPGPRFGSFRAADAAGPAGGGRLLIDLVATPTTDPTPAAPATPAAPEAPAAPVPPLLDPTPAGGLRTVVVDAGHGGDESGVTGPGGTLEKTITLGVARRLKAALEARLGVRVIMTRDRDGTVGLDERAAMANNNKADLFISLHANASVRPTMAGAEVFFLSLGAYGEEAERAARTDRLSLPVFGGGARDIEVIPWEMAQAGYIERSSTLAQAAERALRERIPMSPRSLQQAPFRVLVGANMPAILVEMGFLTNPEQEKALATEAYQNAVAAALVDAIVRFRDGAVTPPADAPGGSR